METKSRRIIWGSLIGMMVLGLGIFLFFEPERYAFRVPKFKIDSNELGVLDDVLVDADLRLFGSYTTRGQEVYYVDFRGNQSLIRGADPATSVVFQDDYGKDAFHMYYGGQMLYQADPATFEIIRSEPAEEYWSPDRPSRASLAKDAHAVYRNAGMIDAGDPATFRILEKSGYQGYQIDKKFVYYDGWPINDSNPAEFELIENSGYGKDNRHVYYKGQIVRGEDPATFGWDDVQERYAR